MRAVFCLFFRWFSRLFRLLRSTVYVETNYIDQPDLRPYGVKKLGPRGCKRQGITLDGSALMPFINIGGKMGILIAGILMLLPGMSFGETCDGYEEPRVFLEAQAWWQGETDAFPGRHIHVGTCFPLEQNVSGIVHFDVVLHLHEMQGNGEIRTLHLDFRRPGTLAHAGFSTNVSVDLSCEVSDCSWVIPMDVDTNVDPEDGLRVFHFRAKVVPTADGSTFFAATYWNAVLNNGKRLSPPSDPTTLRSPGGTNWYTGVKYVRMLCPANGYDFVSLPQSGVVSIQCNFTRETAFASIDPSFHAVPPDLGMVVLDESTGGTKTLLIDTTTLPNGEHKLFMRTSTVGVAPPGVGSGVLVLPFTVNN